MTDKVEIHRFLHACGHVGEVRIHGHPTPEMRAEAEVFADIVEGTRCGRCLSPCCIVAGAWHVWDGREAP